MNILAVFAALGGYALGTAQILFIDWINARRSHARDLRALRAELERLTGMDRAYDWRDEGPTDDTLPKVPMPLSIYLDTISRTDFYLTDEHHDDNTQRALLSIIDGCETLDRYAKDVARLADQAGQASIGSETRAKLRNRAVATSQEYDEVLRQLQFQLKDAIRDVDRRLAEVSYWRQANRPLGRLPTGTNPPPLVRNDPRLREAKNGGS